MELLYKLVSPLVSIDQDDFFNELLKQIDYHFDSLTVGSITQLKKQNKSLLKGVFFEKICYKLLEHNAFPNLKIYKVWMANKQPNVMLNANSNKYDVLPNEYRLALSLSNKDMGIDLIALTYDNNWVAIQCKYRMKPRRTHYNGIRLNWSVKWKDLSTFYSLCHRTGPQSNVNQYNGTSSWYKHIVMSNTLYTSRQGKMVQKIYLYVMVHLKIYLKKNGLRWWGSKEIN